MANDHFRVSNLAYDANGNIQALKRYDDSGSVLYDLEYTYYSDMNRLEQVAGYTEGAYEYDEIGQMTSFQRADDSRWDLQYDVAGRVKRVSVSGTNRLSFKYDDRGFRISKKEHEFTNEETVYVRDASGSILAVYEENGDGTYSSIEHPVYGASRLGTYYHSDATFQYEVKDHLGNVRSVVKPAGDFSVEEEPGFDPVTREWSYYFEGSDALDNPSISYGEMWQIAYEGDYAWMTNGGSAFIQFPVSAGDEVSFSLYALNGIRDGG